MYAVRMSRSSMTCTSGIAFGKMVGMEQIRSLGSRPFSGRSAPIPDLASKKGWSSRRNQTLRMPPECVSLNLSHHRHDEERRDAAISATVASARDCVASLIVMGRSTEAGMAHIKGLHHNAYRCRDSEETRAWYEDFLGLKLVSAFPIDEGRALHTFFQMDDGSCLAFFEVPGKPFDFK